MISVWLKFYSFDPETVLHFHFTFKLFLGHAQKRERVREREREREKERKESREPLLMTDRATRKAELAEIVQSFDRWDHLPRSPRSREAPRRSRSRLRADRNRAKCRSRSRKGLRLSLFLILSIWLDLIFFFSGFCLCFYIEEWMILYIRFATEKMWENVSNK